MEVEGLRVAGVVEGITIHTRGNMIENASHLSRVLKKVW